MNKELTAEEQKKLIAGRIHDEYRKHPNLEFWDIAAGKLYSQWDEYFKNLLTESNSQYKEEILNKDEKIKELRIDIANWTDMYNKEAKENNSRKRILEGQEKCNQLELQIMGEKYNLLQSELSSLRDQNKRLQEGIEWIDIGDRLPVIKKSDMDVVEVLGLLNGKTPMVLSYITGDTEAPQFYLSVGRIFENVHKEVTHWMPLPNPPKEEKK